MLDALANVASQIAVLDKQARTLAQNEEGVRHLMSVPGVSPITALAFTAAMEDPHRFGSNRDVGAYLGLTPKRYQSGERDVSLSISGEETRWCATISTRPPIAC